MDLSTLNKPKTTVAPEKDVIMTGSFLLDSDIHDMIIDTAWVNKSTNGALGVNLTLKAGQKTLRTSIYITSGNDKGNKTTYTDKDGAEQYLPGFSQIDSMCLLAIGKSITELSTTKKVIKVYDFAVSKEVPTEVDMLMDLLGASVKVGVVKQIVDKTKLNSATNSYEPTGETREVNEVAKFFRARDSLTTAEIRAGVTEPEFYNTWLTAHKGVVQNRSKGKSSRYSGSYCGGSTKADCFKHV